MKINWNKINTQYVKVFSPIVCSLWYIHIHKYMIYSYLSMNSEILPVRIMHIIIIIIIMLITITLHHNIICIII